MIAQTTIADSSCQRQVPLNSGQSRHVRHAKMHVCKIMQAHSGLCSPLEGLSIGFIPRLGRYMQRTLPGGAVVTDTDL